MSARNGGPGGRFGLRHLLRRCPAGPPSLALVAEPRPRVRLAPAAGAPVGQEKPEVAPQRAAEALRRELVIAAAAMELTQSACAGPLSAGGRPARSLPASSSASRAIRWRAKRRTTGRRRDGTGEDKIHKRGLPRRPPLGNEPRRTWTETRLCRDLEDAGLMCEILHSIRQCPKRSESSGLSPAPPATALVVPREGGIDVPMEDEGPVARLVAHRRQRLDQRDRLPEVPDRLLVR
jgi:hypothetical protein